MNIKFWNQPKSTNLGKILNEKLRKGFKKVWIVAGMTKDSGADMIIDSVEVARNLGTEVNVMIGIDRKNTSKDMLMKFFKLGCNLFVHINRDDKKVETRLYVFESDDESFVYQSSGKFSEGGLSTNNCLIQELIYGSEDRKLFENFKSVFIQGAEEVFKPVGEEEIKLLAEKGEIVARITDRKIPSISEMYGGMTMKTIANDEIYDDDNSSKLFDIPTNDDFNIDIDILSGDIRKTELSAETEAKKENKIKEDIDKLADEKLAKFYDDGNDKENEKKVTIIKGNEEVNLSNAQILVFESNKIIDKGLGEGEIKIPHYLYEGMSKFFGEKFEHTTDDKSKERFANRMKFEILDVNTDEEYTDDNVLLYDAGRYFAIRSSKLNNLSIEENDILRLIKIADNEFKVEIVRKNTNEHDIWESFCKCTMKNSKRKFGIM